MKEPLVSTKTMKTYTVYIIVTNIAVSLYKNEFLKDVVHVKNY